MHIDVLKSFNPGNQGEMYLPLFGLKNKNYFLISLFSGLLCNNSLFLLVEIYRGFTVVVYWSSTSFINTLDGAQWLSGRVLDPRPRGCGFKPHLRHWVVSLSKTHFSFEVLVQPRQTCPDITEKLLTGT